MQKQEARRQPRVLHHWRSFDAFVFCFGCGKQVTANARVPCQRNRIDTAAAPFGAEKRITVIRYGDTKNIDLPSPDKPDQGGLEVEP